MKVLHLSSEKTWRGGEQQIAYLMDELKNTHQVETLAAARAGSEFAKRMIAKGHHIIELPFRSELDVVTAWKIKELVKKEKIDIVHMHAGHAHTLGVLAKVLGHEAKLVLSKRTDYPIKNNFVSKWKFNHPSIERILCVSAKIKEVLKPDMHQFEKVEVVYSGIDIQKFPSSPIKNLKEILKLPKEAKVVINTSAISDQKDYSTFVAVAQKLAHLQDLYFVICGEGPLQSEIEQLIADKNLKNKVLLTGFRKDLPEFLGSADLFLITSQDEGLGTSILDAFATSLPVVATNAGGIPEIVRHQETGLVAKVKDAETLASHVEELLYKNLELKEKLKKNAKALVLEFSFKRTAEQTLAVYESLQ